MASALDRLQRRFSTQRRQSVTFSTFPSRDFRPAGVSPPSGRPPAGHGARDISGSTKESTPEYEMFTTSIGNLLAEGRTLFKIESGDDDSKREQYNKTLGALSVVRQSIDFL